LGLFIFPKANFTIEPKLSVNRVQKGDCFCKEMTKRRTTMKGRLRLSSALILYLVFSLLVAVPLMASAGTVEEWVARYNGPGNSYDNARALAVDASGNVYVTGASVDDYGGFKGPDYATVKYDTNGNQLWVARYGLFLWWDVAHAIAVDASGNVYVTGGSGWNFYNQDYDYVTVKYSQPTHDTYAVEWVARYKGPGDGWDVASAIAVDASGNVYVTGNSYGAVTRSDYATVKYDPDGTELWVARYNNDPVNGTDEANALAIDSLGNVYVTGSSESLSTVSGNFVHDYATVKYAPDGTEVWVQRYNYGEKANVNFEDEAEALAVDSSGNVYVTGSSEGFIVDLMGPRPEDYDYATVKYAPDGTELWVQRYNYSEDDKAEALAIDTLGNVYVTGSSECLSLVSGDFLYGYATVKYAPDRRELWARRYNALGTDHNRASAIAVDASGNVYVTGTSHGSGTDDKYATVKYDTDGNVKCIPRYNGPGSGTDRSSAIAVDASGNVYVTGMSIDNGTGGYDYATVKYTPITSYCCDLITLPNYLDWIDSLLPVRNQRKWGACWAFSAVGVVEGAYSIQLDIIVDLSEQNLISDCGCNDALGPLSCRGGHHGPAMKYT
jgi:uncharacterized delta-60 repeat protein